VAFVRFDGLKARGIVKSRQELKILQEKWGFSRGRLIGPNTRAWDEETEIDPWLAACPTALKKTPKSPGPPAQEAQGRTRFRDHQQQRLTLVPWEPRRGNHEDLNLNA
jgi:hypothetical protein